MGGTYQVCRYLRGKIKVFASGLTIGEAATLRNRGTGLWMRYVRNPYTT